MSKYKSRKITLPSGETFDSRGELNRWIQLKDLERCGTITQLARQVRFEIIPMQKKPSGGHERKVEYVADFVYRTATGERIVEDFKGFRTPEYVIKRKLMLKEYGVEILESGFQKRRKK